MRAPYKEIGLIKLEAEGNEIVCKECGWFFTHDLIEKLVKNEIVYCERCGAESKPSEHDIEQLKKMLTKPPAPFISPTSYIKTKGKKALKKIKNKIDNLKQK